MNENIIFSKLWSSLLIVIGTASFVISIQGIVNGTGEIEWFYLSLSAALLLRGIYRIVYS